MLQLVQGQRKVGEGREGAPGRGREREKRMGGYRRVRMGKLYRGLLLIYYFTP